MSNRHPSAQTHIFIQRTSGPPSCEIRRPDSAYYNKALAITTMFPEHKRRLLPPPPESSPCKRCLLLHAAVQSYGVPSFTGAQSPLLPSPPSKRVIILRRDAIYYNLRRSQQKQSERLYYYNNAQTPLIPILATPPHYNNPQHSRPPLPILQRSSGAQTPHYYYSAHEPLRPRDIIRRRATTRP